MSSITWMSLMNLNTFVFILFSLNTRVGFSFFSHHLDCFQRVSFFSLAIQCIPWSLYSPFSIYFSLYFFWNAKVVWNSFKAAHCAVHKLIVLLIRFVMDWTTQTHSHIFHSHIDLETILFFYLSFSVSFLGNSSFHLCLTCRSRWWKMNLPMFFNFSRISWLLVLYIVVFF